MLSSERRPLPFVLRDRPVFLSERLRQGIEGSGVEREGAVRGGRTLPGFEGGTDHGRPIFSVPTSLKLCRVQDGYDNKGRFCK